MNASHALPHAWRSLRRAPLFTATVVLTLAIGVGSTAAISAIVDAVLLRPLPYGHPEQLVGAWHDLPPLSMVHAQQTSATYFTYKQFAHTIDGIGAYDDGSVNVSDPDGRTEPQRLVTAWVSASLIPVLQVPPLLGRSFTEAEDRPKGPATVILSEGMWRTRFGGDRNVIGRTLYVSGTPREIIGVMPERFRFPGAGTQLWLPLALDPNDPNPGGFNHNAIARLKAGVTVDAAQRDFAAVLPRILEISPNVAPGVPTQMLLDQAKPAPKLVPLKDDVVGEISRTLWMVAATVVLVLLVTCANVANLFLVRAEGRQRELAVRAALGAGRSHVLVQFLTESFILAGLASMLGLGAAAVALRLLVSAGPAEIPRLAEVRLDGAVIAFTIIVAALVAIACSAVPAIRWANAPLLAGLREGGRGGTTGRTRQRARSVLVAAQMAFALVVLAGSGLLLRSFQRLHAVRPGFNPEHVATLWLSLPTARYPNDSSVVRFYARLADRAAAIRGVQAVGLTSRLPLEPHGTNANPLYAEGDESSATTIPPLQIYATINGDYFRALGLPLVAGRTFDRLDGRQRWDEAIVSRATAVRFWHDSTGAAALGKRFRSLPGGPWYTVVGVVGSARDTSLSAPPTPAVYFPEAFGADTLYGQLARMMGLVVRTNGDLAATARAVQQAVRELDVTLPTFDVRSLSAVVSASMARLSYTIVVLGVAAAVTLVLGVVGLYGVIAYVVTLRTRELGVRLALGAQPREVAVMVTRQGLVLSGAGIVVGLALVVLAGRFLRSFLFEIGPTDPVTLGAATVTLVAFATLASWIPARRAARVDPLEALRAD